MKKAIKKQNNVNKQRISIISSIVMKRKASECQGYYFRQEAQGGLLRGDDIRKIREAFSEERTSEPRSERSEGVSRAGNRGRVCLMEGTAHAEVLTQECGRCV